MEDQATLRHHGIRISMSGNGKGNGNAIVETVFKTLKSELVWRTTFVTRAHAERDIARYADGFYTPHSAPFGAPLTQPRTVQKTRDQLT